jgi:hypothetical protein
MGVRSALRAGRPLPPGRFLVLISVRGWVDSRPIVRLEGLGQLKNPVTSACSIVPQPLCMYGCIDPRFLDLGTSWRWVVSFTPLPLYPRYPLDRRLGGPQSQSGWRGEEKILYPTGTRTPTPSSSSWEMYCVFCFKHSRHSQCLLASTFMFVTEFAVRVNIYCSKYNS